MSIWLPSTISEFTSLEVRASDLDTPVAGIVISPSSHGSGNIASITAEYKDFTTLILDGKVSLAMYPSGVALYQNDPKIAEISRRYRYRANLVGLDTVFYSNRLLVPIENE